MGHFYPDDAGSILFQKFCNHIRAYTVLWPERKQYESSLLRKPKITHKSTTLFQQHFVTELLRGICVI